MQAGTNNAVANFSYNYDVLGNLTSRADANQNVSESFTYDGLNRLTQSTVSLSPTPLVKTFSYDPIGNLLAKSDVGNYLYPTAGSALPHAVTSVSGGSINATFMYDANGNQTAGLGRSITYTSYNKPNSITQGSKTLFFSHGPDHQRFKQNAPEGVTLYFDVFGAHVELVQATTSTWNEYLAIGDALVGVRFEHSDETISTRYFTTDHLGSVAVITDESGNAVERLSYDAWGKRRFINGTDDPADSITSQTSRGFTGQEFLADVGLVHLNGRIYDPLLGRMMSADPYVPDPTNGQAWNRYSYVINNPLSITDPNGYCFLGLCGIGRAIGNFFSSVFHGLQNLLRSAPILGDILKIAAVFACGGNPLCAIPVAFASSAFVAGVTSGNLGAALKAGLIAAATAAAFYEVGQITAKLPGAIAGPDGSHGTFELFSEGHLANIAGHALVGCASSVASGGKCGPGALAAGVTSAAGPIINDPSGFNASSLAANAVLGGSAAVAGGGKFANGAVTAAFGYLINQTGHSGNDPNERHQMGVAMAMADYASRGYLVIQQTEVPVIVPGFATSRVYDFIVQDPVSLIYIGVEVKTTLYDTIRLNSAQVAKDVVVMQQGGYSPLLNLPIKGVGYNTFCWACEAMDFRSTALQSILRSANIPFTHGGSPGDLRQ